MAMIVKMKGLEALASQSDLNLVNFGSALTRPVFAALLAGWLFAANAEFEAADIESIFRAEFPEVDLPPFQNSEIGYAVTSKLVGDQASELKKDATVRIPWSSTQQSLQTSTTANMQISGAFGTSIGMEYLSDGQRAVTPGLLAVPDQDYDGFVTIVDNCTEAANPEQRDTDQDSFGNYCDPDFDNNGIVNIVDLGIMRSVFFSGSKNVDLDGDGAVNVSDLGLLRLHFFSEPGPSGLR